MQDEQFIRQWSKGHEDFTSDLHSMLNQFGRYQRSRKDEFCTIGPAYSEQAETDAQPALSPAAKASLRGLGASVITAALWLVVIAVATPGPGLAAATDTLVVTCDCAAYVPLA